MATSPSPAQSDTTRNARLPPRRGQIKAQIIEGIIKTVSSAAARAGNAIGIGHGAGAGDNYTTAPESPPPTAYNSDDGKANN